MSNKQHIVFMGTPGFAVPALQALHQAYGVSAVVTVPDKPSGRGLTIHPSAVKAEAIKLGIKPILQPTRLTDPVFVEQLRSLNPAIICVIAFRILPSIVYSIASSGAFNVHASLLPKYRGAAPINHAIMNGDTQSGVSSFILSNEVDAGSLLMQIPTSIVPGTTAGELYETLSVLAAECAVTTTEMLLKGTATPIEQNAELASLAPKVFRDASWIDWNQSADAVLNRIHGLSPTPCAWTLWNGCVLKIFRAQRAQAPLQAGEWRITNTNFIVGCGSGSIQLSEIQLPGKKRIHAIDWVRGYRGVTAGTMSMEDVG